MEVLCQVSQLQTSPDVSKAVVRENAHSSSRFRLLLTNKWQVLRSLKVCNEDSDAKDE